jgi:thymidylate synthase (FAD)
MPAIITLKDITDKPLDKMGENAAVCYAAGTEENSNLKRANHCRDKGHLMVLRFAYATFNIKGISRSCSHQIVRVAHAGILQESQRYVNMSQAKFIDPPSLLLVPEDLQAAWKENQTNSIRIYKDCVANGMKKEDARYIIPTGCETQLNMCLNFHGWKDFLRARTSKASQWEVREVATTIRNILNEQTGGFFGE